MKAIQITAPSEMKVVDIEKPVLEPGEVLVKIKYVGFCGSDLNTFLGRNPMVKLPVIPGHEVGAVIEAVGKDVPDSLKPGMSVTVNPYTNCGKCASCRNGRVNACEHNETLGVQRNGAMCEYIALPWSKIIPAHRIPPRDCALIEPMSVGFHAVSRAQVTDIDIVMVIGCGMIGWSGQLPFFASGYCWKVPHKWESDLKNRYGLCRSCAEYIPSVLFHS